MKIPAARGPVSEAVTDVLGGRATALPGRLDRCVGNDDEDLQLTLYVCYELHYGGFDGVDDRWEWDPALIALRRAAEDCFEASLPAPPSAAPHEIPAALGALVEADDGPPLSKYVMGRATLEQFREFVMHRSVYQLREADPHTFAIPRLSGRAKAALVEIQADEYGGGRVNRMHAELFRATMHALDLDTAYGAYVERVPAVTLATNNLMSLFGLNRRLRGAATGHLAAYEMTSSLPNRRYGNGLRRLGFGADATRYYDEHVEADAVHEQIAAHDMCGSLCAAEPEQCGPVLLGAASALTLDARFAAHLLEAWSTNRSSLREF
jgi:hypothetical protein